jgi:O-antigen/teichoic acid export membrane protein
MNFKISNLEFFKSVISTVSFENLYNNKQSIYFIIINIVVAFLGFVRSFAFMKFLDLKELGFLTLIQTGAMLIGFFQIGLINGGYRILALQDSKLSKDTNNVLFSYFGILFIVLLGIYAIGSITGLITENLIVFITILIGLFALLNNWIINMLIASREYDRLNKANLLSVLLSVACLPLAYFYGIYGGAISLLIQPLALVIFVLLTGRNLWINKFSISVLKLKNILHYGFIPYLSEKKNEPTKAN